MEANDKSYQYKLAQKKVKRIKDFYVHLLVFLFVNIAIIAVSSIDEGLFNGLQEPENYFTAFFWGIGLFFHWWNVFGPNIFFGKNWEEKKIKELMEKEKQKSWE
ncbi:2TM domain-containing protein [Salinimicrobium tongyeongense]|uniref:2TM domain-containing protein n=1 Tax=Salinimicrobium tongyeongense TaxID=2809707 RepID=A0ABY6NQS7_9FLAO|nr:2TM domain-containing protein [Salinimicrobium tongyeongense]UZH55249.1 2TM domain-containing protein [Salinimicrobium tongyeongense]